MGSKFVEAAVFPLYTVFLVAYSKNLGNDSAFVLEAIIIAILVELVMIPVWGWVTDKVGRKKVFLGAAILNLVLIWPAFAAISSGDALPIVAILVAGLALGHAGTYAPMIASGPFTVVATALLVAGGGSITGVAIYVSVLTLVSVVCLALLPETAPGPHGGKEYANWTADDSDAADSTSSLSPGSLK